jgi:hypothetical protein
MRTATIKASLRGIWHALAPKISNDGAELFNHFIMDFTSPRKIFSKIGEKNTQN